MRIRKTSIVITALILSGIALNAFLPSPPTPPPNPQAYEQEPPSPKHFWIQKLNSLTPDSCNITFKVEYEPDTTMGSGMIVYYAKNEYIKVYDDGIAPDVKANDFIYSAYVREDTAAMVADFEARTAKIALKGKVVRWTGHDGEMITTLPAFKKSDFYAGIELEISSLLLTSSGDCDEVELKAQNSLFITDLSVVEDGARARNANGGNGLGAWTFAHLMLEAANESGGGADVKDFLKSWLKCFVANQTVNGQIVLARGPVHVRKYLIGPWLEAATGQSYDIDHDSWDWEAVWDDPTTEVDALLNTAPFKLMAIVNRLDVRANPAYTSQQQNTGELRFIFTLINPFTGQVPVHDNIVTPQTPFGDWIGMNVIFEYSALSDPDCGLSAIAKKWVDLSNMTLGSEDYNAALEEITEPVVTHGAGGSTMANKSRLLRIRTNERLLANGPVTNAGWEKMNWELRQFEIDPVSHILHMTPVTNTPLFESSDPLNIGVTQSVNAMPGVDPILATQLGNWAFAMPNKALIKQGRHNMPQSMLAGSAIVFGDRFTYWDFPWVNYDPSIAGTFTNFANNPNAMTVNQIKDARLIRHQMSLNTCQGCHSGENKTEFTQVYPRGFGEAADYWSSTPSVQSLGVDVRFHNNTGTTTLSTAAFSGNYQMPLTPTVTSTPHHQVVSPFITGRRYFALGSTHTWDDDYGTSPDDNDDANMKGLFYINDPSNNGTATVPALQTQYGFNELMRRQSDLCALADCICKCNPFVVTKALIKNIAFMPLPKGGH